MVDRVVSDTHVENKSEIGQHPDAQYRIEKEPLQEGLVEEAEEAVVASTAQDDKNIVTPYAFGVASALLGTPLAPPWRRLAALFIDSSLIALLSYMNDLFLPLAIAWVCFMLRRNMLATSRFWVFKPALKGMVFLFSFVFVLACFDVLFGDGLSDYVEPTTTEEVETTNSALKNKIVDGIDEDDVVITLGDVAEGEGPNEPSVISWVKGILADLGISFGWAAAYYTFLVSWWRGATVGKRLLGIQVIKLDGSALSLWEAFGRYGGYGAGLATGLLGFAQIYWDANRQSIQDKISETLVITKR